MKVWEHVLEELDRRGIKAAATWLGERCGYSAQRMTNWSKRDIPPREYIKIAAELGTTVEWVASASGRAPRESDLVASPEAALLAAMRPELRELVLAYNDLLPEDQEALARPIFAKAAEARRYYHAALARSAATPAAHAAPGEATQEHERWNKRLLNIPRHPERRNSLVRGLPTTPKQRKTERSG